MTTHTENTIKDRRERLSLSQRALAAEAGVSQSAYWKVENGRSTDRATRRVVLDALHRLEQA